MTIQGDAAFVTGDDVGIGRQISTKLADYGIMVVVADIDAEVRRETVDTAGGTAIETHLNLTNAASIVNTRRWHDRHPGQQRWGCGPTRRSADRSVG